MTDLSFDVVVPAHNASWCLKACLKGLKAADFGRVFVVDDGSTDATAQIAREQGVEVISNQMAEGAAAARAKGALHGAGDVLLFVDADVVVAPDTKRRLATAMRAPDIAAVFGAYDDNPTAAGLVSQYRNLLHRYVHLTGARRATTFWTGLGAVRRAAYEAVDGIDPKQRMMEDIEFGMRLNAAGYGIVLQPDITGTHLKQWGWRSMAKADLFDRAIPWSRLFARNSDAFVDLNLTRARKVAALASAGVALGALASPVTGWGFGVLVVSLLVFAFLNAAFLKWLAQRRGAVFALFAILPHLVHNWCALAGFAFVKVERLFRA